VIIATIPMIIYVFLLVLIGIIVEYTYVVGRNAKILSLINSYGRDPNEKYTSAISKLQSTGLFLFCTYKYNNRYLACWILIYKLTVLLRWPKPKNANC
jgi:hypothetical protein